MAVSEAERQAFKERGFFHVAPIYNSAELSEIEAEYDRILSNAMHIGEQGETPFDYSPLLTVQGPILLRHACNPKLVEVAIALLGPDVRLYWDQAVYKKPGMQEGVGDKGHYRRHHV